MKPPIRPVVWTPPRVDLRFRSTTPFPSFRRIALPARGEDVAIDHEGRLIAGLVNGRIVRVHVDSERVETLVDTGGRPIGIEVARDGTLIVCDMRRGLLRVDPERLRIEVLADARVHGLGFCNNAAIAKDGTIYFSDSSQRFGIEHWLGDIMEHSGTGRLLKWTPEGKVHVLAEGLQFANGVALSEDESFVAIAQTGSYRVDRLQLASGKLEPYIEGLPGFPDNIALDDRGLIWIAIAGLRNPLLDFLHRTPPVLRKLVWSIPDALTPKGSRAMRVIAVDASGRVVHDIEGKSDTFHMVTGMRARGDALYLASLEEPALLAMKRPPVLTQA